MPLRAPIFVDVTGRRSRVLRGLGLFVAAAALLALLAVPLSIVLPAGSSAPARDAETSLMRVDGLIWVDQNCDGLRSPDEGVGRFTSVDLVRAGQGPVATTQTTEAGHFSFSGVDPGFDYDLRVHRAVDTASASDAVVYPIARGTTGAYDPSLQLALTDAACSSAS